MIKSILLTVVLGYCAYAALFDKFNAKVATLISTLYLGTGILSGVYGVIGVVRFFSRFMADIPIEIIRDVFMFSIFSLMENLLLLSLLTVMAYTLNRKRKLARK